MEKIDTDCKQRILKSLAKLFKPFNRDWAPLKMKQELKLYAMNGFEGRRKSIIITPKRRIRS